MQPRHAEDDVVPLQLSGGEVDPIRIRSDAHARTSVHASSDLLRAVRHRDGVWALLAREDEAVRFRE